MVFMSSALIGHLVLLRSQGPEGRFAKSADRGVGTMAEDM